MRPEPPFGTNVTARPGRNPRPYVPQFAPRRKPRARHHHHHRRPHRQDRHRPDRRWGLSRRRRCASSIRRCTATTRRTCRPRRCKSAITYLDGDAGILRYGGYPIEQLAEHSTYLEVAYLLLNGELPEQASSSTAGSTTSRTTRSSTRTCASGSSTASTTTPIRWACSCPSIAALGTFYDGAKDIDDPAAAQSSDPAPDRQGADARGDVLPLLGRAAVQLSRQRPVVPGELPEHDVEDRRLRGRSGPRAGDGRAVHPPRRPRAELRHHGDARHRLQPRRPVLVGGRCSVPRCTARCTAAPTRPSCGCSPRSARSTTCRRSSTRSRPAKVA